MRTRLAAIMAADVVGYSRMMSADEPGTFRRVQDVLDAVMRPLIEAHGGQIFKLMGDGVLAEFASVRASVICAVEVQRALAREAARAGEDDPVHLRIGIHLGDVIGHDGDLYGHGVNLAARVEGLAEAGGVCITRAVHDEIQDRLPYALEDLGEMWVKNIPRPLRVYAVRLGDPRAPRVPVVPWSRRMGLAGRGMALAAVLLALDGSLATIAAPERPDSLPALSSASGAVIPRTAANLRAGPGTEFAVIGLARSGDRLTLTGETRVAGERWLQVEGGPAPQGAFIFGPLVDAAASEMSAAPLDLLPAVEIQTVALKTDEEASAAPRAAPAVESVPAPEALFKAAPAAAEPADALSLRISIDFTSGAYTSCTPFGGVQSHRLAVGPEAGWARLHLRHGPDIALQARARRVDGRVEVSLLPYSGSWTERDAIRLVLDDRPGAGGHAYSRRKAQGSLHGCGRLVAYVTRTG